MKDLLIRLTENYERTNNIGMLSQATLCADKLPFDKFREVFQWLIENGGKFIDNKENYSEMGHSDTFHLWLSTPAVKLHIGFCIEGEMDMATRYAMEYQKA